jgi:hypothetical protein
MEMVVQVFKHAGREAPVATGMRSLGGWRRWCGLWYGWCSVGRRVADSVSAVGLVEYVGRLDPVGRHANWLAAHMELQRFLFPSQDLVGTTVRWLQSPSRCVLMEEDVRAVVEVLVHVCIWTGVACCRNWS